MTLKLHEFPDTTIHKVVIWIYNTLLEYTHNQISYLSVDLIEKLVNPCNSPVLHKLKMHNTLNHEKPVTMITKKSIT